MSDYCNFLLSLFEISIDCKYRFKFSKLNEMDNFIGFLTFILKDKVIEKESDQRTLVLESDRRQEPLSND